MERNIEKSASFTWEEKTKNWNRFFIMETSLLYKILFAMNSIILERTLLHFQKLLIINFSEDLSWNIKSPLQFYYSIILLFPRELYYIFKNLLIKIYHVFKSLSIFKILVARRILLFSKKNFITLSEIY